MSRLVGIVVTISLIAFAVIIGGSLLLGHLLTAQQIAFVSSQRNRSDLFLLDL